MRADDRTWRRMPRLRWVWLAIAVCQAACGVYFATQGEWAWTAITAILTVTSYLQHVVASSGTVADVLGLRLGRRHVPWDDVVGFRRQGRDLDVLSLRLADGSEVPLTVPGGQLDELLASPPRTCATSRCAAAAGWPSSANSCATPARGRPEAPCPCHSSHADHSLRRHVRKAGR
ncbi:PH domain-containing protein [Serinicoccus sediminis]|uniref:PH domain-containing protein n=1 Tax=Serinicoccus sediminis TaxID=2306021 RepID=UPI00102188E5|nr:PH domain-containing protein [Serinicoccus sediminis]